MLIGDCTVQSCRASAFDSVNVGTVVEQQPAKLRVPSNRCLVQRSAFSRVDYIHIGPQLDELRSQLQVAAEGDAVHACAHQRGVLSV